MTDVLYEKDVVCPICQSTFPQIMVRHSLCIVEKRDSDFRVQYRNCNPNWYGIVVCPGCGYSAPKSSFDSLKPGDAKKLKPVLEKLGPVNLTGRRTLVQAVESYLRAITCAQALKSPHSVLGGLYLKTAWLYREMEEREKERALLEAALSSYLRAYDHEREIKMALSDLTYLIGELHRRLEKYQEAVVWFSRAVGMKDIRPSTKRLAREMWQLAREANRREPATESAESEIDSRVAEPGVIAQAEPASAVEETTTPTPRRIKSMARVRIYHDQVRWLEQVGRWWGGEPDLESSSVVRALLDLVIDIPPRDLMVSTEAELKEALRKHISAS
ncbi:MAG: DUF2225 domain-containing protein [Firmicutes bacterium]|nr:DUF2225 domain-containing protein [Bacillota bacterium]